MITVYKLREELEKQGSYYFSDDTLKFFGERLSDMYILKKTEKIKDYMGDIHECYVLSKLSKDYKGRKVRKYDYFDIHTLERI